MLIAAILLLVALAVELYAIIAAPFGYQDDTGFHTGVERGRNSVSR
jgi:hypothetical protein